MVVCEEKLLVSLAEKNKIAHSFISQLMKKSENLFIANKNILFGAHAGIIKCGLIQVIPCLVFHVYGISCLWYFMFMVFYVHVYGQCCPLCPAHLL